MVWSLWMRLLLERSVPDDSYVELLARVPYKGKTKASFRQLNSANDDATCRIIWLITILLF